MARKTANPQTLFHLVPTNQVAQDALRRQDNDRFVSSSREGGLGLEVGYHVPRIPQGRVITTLGRGYDADLALVQSSLGNPMSLIHVAFEINPSSCTLVLSVRSRLAQSVSFAEIPTPGDKITGEPSIADGVILYGQDYKLSIASYGFELLWLSNEVEPLKTLTIHGYITSLRLLQRVPSRERPTEYDISEALLWVQTTANPQPLKDIRKVRVEIGHGTFGQVFQAVDETSGHTFAIKVVSLDPRGDKRRARKLVQKEIEIMKTLRHPNIIEYLGHQHIDSLRTEISMPLREKSLAQLVQTRPHPDDGQLGRAVLHQMLSALDYLASKDMVHRDVKPDNILCYTLPDTGDLRFQLADFGLAEHQERATTACGTRAYQAPELRPKESKVVAKQSPKMDIWSLFATILAVKSRFQAFPPRPDSGYGAALAALVIAAPRTSLEPMARLDPRRRASAAQMLVSEFGGRGLTTPRREILPIEPKANDATWTNNNGGRAYQQPEAATCPLVEFQLLSPMSYTYDMARTGPRHGPA